jgi:geranylgeranyl pyrophosphate synthase
VSQHSSPVTPATILDDGLRERLEQLVTATARSAIPWLDQELARLVRRPGKRMRPALLIAAAGCGAPRDLSATLACAAAVELLHQSTLVHDDLMDDAPFRGDEVTMHRTGGRAAAILGGDYLFGVAGRLIAGVSAQAAQVWHESYVDLCEGQARETANRYRVTSPDEYLRTVYGKTASLVRAACELGGVCGGLGPDRVRALRRYGEHFGVLFQIVDDLLDVLSTPELCHKPVGQDVPQGVYSLPVLLAYRPGTDLAGADPGEVYATVRARGVAPVIGEVYAWADRARAALDPLPPSPARDRLRDLPVGYATATLATLVAGSYRDLVGPLLRAAA